MICLKPTYARKAPPRAGLFALRQGDAVADELSRGKALTTAEAAHLAGVSPSTVRMWVARGKLAPAGHQPDGRPLYWQTDVARVEKATRKGARRNVGLRTVATQDIRDDEAVLVRLDCGHLKVLSIHHAPRDGRPVACFECSAEASIAHTVHGPNVRHLAAA
jgi:excisionase family DNA binding protein